MGGCQEGNGQSISKGEKKKIQGRKGAGGGEWSRKDSDPDTKVYRKKEIWIPEKN